MDVAGATIANMNEISVKRLLPVMACSRLPSGMSWEGAI